MDFIGKFIKVIHYNFDLNRYNKITYGFVKSDIIVEDPKNDMLLVGKFCSKPINEFGNCYAVLQIHLLHIGKLYGILNCL